MALNFELAERLAQLAADIDDVKEGWPNVDLNYSDSVVSVMHELAVMLAGKRVEEIYPEES